MQASELRPVACIQEAPKETTMLAMTHNWPLDVTELKPALELVLEIARADMGILMLQHDGEGTMLPVLGHGVDDTKCDLFGRAWVGSGAVGRAIAEHRPL